METTDHPPAPSTPPIEDWHRPIIADGGRTAKIDAGNRETTPDLLPEVRFPTPLSRPRVAFYYACILELANKFEEPRQL